MGGDPARETLNLLPARDGKPYWVDAEGQYWRVYGFIRDTTFYQTVESKEDFYQSARSFGNFQRLLADYPAETLHETIVNFHNTVDRLRQLREAIKRDSCGRAAQVRPEIDCLPWGAKLMTLECGMRFLSDYLSGDVYFKTHREGHNLDRTRTQFRLVAEMEQKWAAMQEIVERYR